MAVTPRVVRGLRGGTSALDLDTEGGRAFLQERVAFFNKVAFWVSGSFFVAAALAGPYYGNPSSPLLHAATLLVSLTAWQVCARGPALSTRLLEAIDAAAVALVLVGFAAQALLVPPAFTGDAAPMLVPGAIAATCPASVMKVPAEAAQAPCGETNTITGSFALSIAWMMSLVDASRPPGVSSSISTATAPSASLCRIACWR